MTSCILVRDESGGPGSLAFTHTPPFTHERMHLSLRSGSTLEEASEGSCACATNEYWAS